MKKIILILVMSFVAIASKAQVSCDMMSLIINNQGWTNTYIQLHHPGYKLINPNSENIIAWKITDTPGNVISQYAVFDNAFCAFHHGTPKTDTMNVSSLLTNDYAKVACLIEDQIYWDPERGIPGMWTLLHNNVGMDVYKTLGINVLQTIIFPADFRVIGYYDMTGRQVHSLQPNQICIEVFNNGARRKILKRL